jgi:hypothetical protein
VHNAMRFGLILSVYGVSFIKLDMEYSCVYVEGVEETDGFQNESDMSQAKDKHQNYVHQKLPPVACVPTPSDPPQNPTPLLVQNRTKKPWPAQIIGRQSIQISGSFLPSRHSINRSHKSGTLNQAKYL